MAAEGSDPPGPPGPGEPPSPGEGAPVPPADPHDPSAGAPDPAGAPSDPVAAVDAATGLPVEARRALEAIVMVAADPVEPQMLAQLLEVSVERVEEACAALAAAYEADDRGFVLARVAGGYRYQSHPDAAPYVERYVLEGQSARLSSAALETLAIVAYKQPLSRAQVASIRGVNVDGVVRTLVHRGLVAEVARDPGPGQAVLYGTTPLFLERLGVDSLDDLPPIASFVPDAGVVEALETGLRLDPSADDPPPGEQAAGDPGDGEGDGVG
ncbi:SMC-Scp complex subunit ScpB [Iamia majanohamensis]|uniref:SMC-Scp complex subunit ScpB n=1 Tax=Iamia majanohamensis TaxID=467976 RepID=A0AAF0BSZ4_9ACTN|nr:SMC-Scp complex subunit ScpB [Iamia majanohamensis]WCO69141.1 SMC-Scp complex subunit ScpB [Iamia majanohamensis]